MKLIYSPDLVSSQTYTHKFQCPYELSSYPFDTQVCIKFLSNISSLSLSDLLHKHGNGKHGYGNSEFDSRPPDYEPRSQHAHLSHHKMECGQRNLKEEQDRNKDGHCDEEEDHKRDDDHLLLTAITFATTFFKPFFFEAALRKAIC